MFSEEGFILLYKFIVIIQESGILFSSPVTGSVDFKVVYRIHLIILENICYVPGPIPVTANTKINKALFQFSKRSQFSFGVTHVMLMQLDMMCDSDKHP